MVTKPAVATAVRIRVNLVFVRIYRPWFALRLSGQARR